MSETVERSERDWFKRFLGVMALALAILVVFLARQNRELKRQLEESATPIASLVPGERLGPVRLLDSAGASLPLTFTGDGRRTLLLFFTPTCPACSATIPAWREIVASLESPPTTLGIDLGPMSSAGDREALVTAGWPFPVFHVDPEGSSGLARIPYVPATVILDGNGVVERVWFGQLDPGGQEELRAALATPGF